MPVRVSLPLITTLITFIYLHEYRERIVTMGNDDGGIGILVADTSE